MSDNNCYMALFSSDNIYNSTTTTLTNEKSIHLDLNNIITDLALVYIDILQLRFKPDIQIYIDNVTKILETKQYEFIGKFLGKLFFVNKSIFCNNVHYCDISDNLYVDDSDGPMTTIHKLANNTPVLVYCHHTIELENNKKFDCVTVKKIMPCTTYGELFLKYNFYIVTKREYKTKAAIKK